MKRTEVTLAQRRRIAQLAEQLAARDMSILAHVVRVVDGKRPMLELKDFGGEVITTVSAKEAGDDPRAFFLSLAGIHCIVCLSELLDGEEEGICGSCEAATVMDLLRLRDQLR